MLQHLIGVTGTSAPLPHEDRGSLVGGGGVDARRTRRKANVLVKGRTRFVGGSDLDLHEEGAVRTALFRAVDCFETGPCHVRVGVSVRSFFSVRPGWARSERARKRGIEEGGNGTKKEEMVRGTGDGGLTGGRVDVLPTVFASEDVVDLFPLQVRPLDILNVRKEKDQFLQARRSETRKREDGPVSRAGTRKDRWHTPTCCRSVLRRGRVGWRNTGSCACAVVRRLERVGWSGLSRALGEGGEMKRVSAGACTGGETARARAYKIIGWLFSSRLLPVCCWLSPSRAKPSIQRFSSFSSRLPTSSRFSQCYAGQATVQNWSSP